MRFFQGLILILFIQSSLTNWLLASDTVSFSGKVKKVLEEKSKLTIKDPETKKWFTVILVKQTKFKGFGGIKDLHKKDYVTGKYFVTDKGLYIATELNKIGVKLAEGNSEEVELDSDNNGGMWNTLKYK